MKQVLETRSAPPRHWVGNGFPVHGLFGYNGAGVTERSPFLLLDYAAPYPFDPNRSEPRGVGQHPHRGFETVTIVFQGELAHRDSTGRGGIIGQGDVQWMTAGGGILHDEFHSERYSQDGGLFEVVQLWVNLPARHKMAPPGYQAITAANIPEVALHQGDGAGDGAGNGGDDGAGDVGGDGAGNSGGDNDGATSGTLRVIAGSFQGVHGPARTFTPMNVWDVRLRAGATAQLDQPPGWAALVVVLAGTVQVNGQALLHGPEVATLSAAGTGVLLRASVDARLLILAGEPIAEPVVGHGPFVMNSRDEIAQAITDFNAGRFGQMPA